MSIELGRHRDVIVVSIGDEVAYLKSDAVGPIVRRLLHLSHEADEWRKLVTGANEFRATPLTERRVAVAYREHKSVFSSHTKSARGRHMTRRCYVCQEDIVPGDTYWREADEVERKTWSGAMVCNKCVRPELRATGLVTSTAVTKPQGHQ